MKNQRLHSLTLNSFNHWVRERMDLAFRGSLRKSNVSSSLFHLKAENKLPDKKTSGIENQSN